MFGDFLTLAMDQLVNQAAKIHYMSGGGAARPDGAAHDARARRGARRRSTPRACTRGSATSRDSRSRCPRRRTTPRACSRPRSATTTRSSSSRTSWRTACAGRFPRRSTSIPLGVADVKRAGTDITIVATSSMVYVALEAAELLAGEGISAEVVDPRTHDAARRGHAHRVGPQDGPGARRRRGPPELRRVRRARSGDRRGRVLLPGRSGDTYRRDGRASPVLAAARGS